MPRAKGVPTVEVTLDGKPYKIAFTWGTRLRAKEYFESLKKDPTTVSQFESITAAIWAGMEDEDRAGLSVEQISDMIHPGNEPEILAKISELTEKSEPDPEVKTDPGAARELTPGAMNSNESGQSPALTYR